MNRGRTSHITGQTDRQTDRQRERERETERERERERESAFLDSSRHPRKKGGGRGDSKEAKETLHTSQPGTCHGLLSLQAAMSSLSSQEEKRGNDRAPLVNRA